MRRILISLILSYAFSSAAHAETIRVAVDGMVCEFCVVGIEHGFKKQAAVESVKVSLEEKNVTLTTKADATLSDDVIQKTIKDAGYEAGGIVRE
jgi:copper chaperone CopZ